MTLSKQQMKTFVTITESCWCLFTIALNIYIWHYSSFIAPGTPLEQKLLACFLLSSIAIVYILIAATIIAYFISLYFSYKNNIEDFSQKIYYYFIYSFKTYTLYIRQNLALDLNDLKDDDEFYKTEELDDDDYNYSIISRKKRKNTIKKLKKRKNKTI